MPLPEIAGKLYINAGLFAIVHSTSLGHIGVQFTGGVLFASLYEKKGSIVSPFIVHSLGNISILALQCLYLF